MPVLCLFINLADRHLRPGRPHPHAHPRPCPHLAHNNPHNNPTTTPQQPQHVQVRASLEPAPGPAHAANCDTNPAATAAHDDAANCTAATTAGPRMLDPTATATVSTFASSLIDPAAVSDWTADSAHDSSDDSADGAEASSSDAGDLSVAASPWQPDTDDPADDGSRPQCGVPRPAVHRQRTQSPGEPVVTLAAAAAAPPPLSHRLSHPLPAHMDVSEGSQVPHVRRPTAWVAKFDYVAADPGEVSVVEGDTLVSVECGNFDVILLRFSRSSLRLANRTHRVACSAWWPCDSFAVTVL